MLAQMAIKFSHEALAEAHDFIIGFTLGIEVRTTFTAADRHAGQRVLENLLKTEELDDSEINGRMKTEAALVRTK